MPVVAGVVSAVSLALVVIIAYFTYKRWKNKRCKQQDETSPELSSSPMVTIVHLFRIWIWYLFFIWVLRRFQHCTGHITTGSWKGRGNQYIQLVKILYFKLLTKGKQLPPFPLEVGDGN